MVDDTPQKVPFLSGESYKPLMTAVVPRLIWPDKPEERFGNTFGKRYGFLPEAEDGTNSVNCPWLTEMYANFGVTGVMVGMFVVGLMIAALEWFLCHWTMTPYEQIIGASILFPLFYQDSNFSLMVGSVPLTVITFWIFSRLFHLRRCFGIGRLWGIHLSVFISPQIIKPLSVLTLFNQRSVQRKQGPSCGLWLLLEMTVNHETYQKLDHTAR